MATKYRIVKILCPICGDPKCDLAGYGMAAEEEVENKPPKLRVVAVNKSRALVSLRDGRSTVDGSIYKHSGFTVDKNAVVRNYSTISATVRQRNAQWYAEQRAALEREIAQQAEQATVTTQEAPVAQGPSVEELFSALREVDNAVVTESVQVERKAS